MAKKSRVLTDHNEIREWAEERDAQPACVRGTGSEEDVGMIRLDFPGYSGETSLEPIEWEEWLQKFDENNLALLVEFETAGGETSNFNKIIGRETAASQGRKTSRRAGRGSGRKKSSQRRSASSARGSSRRSSARRATSSRSSRSRSGRTTSARASKRRSSRSSGKVTGKKRAQSARGSSRSRSRRRAA